jgi:hypothetical protein
MTIQTAMMPMKQKRKRRKTMAANLEIIDGLAQFVFNAEHGDPWHLNLFDSHKVTLDNPTSWGEFVTKIREARPAVLSDHSMQPVFVQVGDRQVALPDQFAVVREQDQRVVPGVVGSRFHVGQPMEALDALRTLVVDVGGEPSTAGLLGEGTRFFASAKIKDFSLDLGSGDSIDRYVMVAFGFDGSLSRNYVVSSIRPVCSNTVSMSLARREDNNSRRVRNTSLTFDSRNETALVEMADIIRTVAQDNDRIVRMVETRSKAEDLAMVAKALFGESKQAQRIAEEVQELSHTAPGQDLPTAQGTIFGLQNSFTYLIDHRLRVGGARKGSGDSFEVQQGVEAADKLLSHRLFGKGAEYRQKLNVVIDGLMDERNPIVPALTV